jgi:hypothetical protein
MGMDLTRVYKKSSHGIQILDTWDLDKLNLFAKSLSNNPNLSLVRHKNSSSFGDSLLFGPHFSRFAAWFELFYDPIYCNLSHAGHR